LTRNAPIKAVLSIIIKFAKPKDANKIIDKGLYKVAIVCSYYAQEHNTRECLLKLG
ncbi:hypothetical protein K458DRAFT_288993, partial [Lentithecium fluviatile CBS 122367]